MVNLMQPIRYSNPDPRTAQKPGSVFVGVQPQYATSTSEELKEIMSLLKTNPSPSDEEMIAKAGDKFKEKFVKESTEHPSLPKPAIKQIVKDHMARGE